MAANFSPQSAVVQINTGNSNLDGTGAITDLIIGDTSYGFGTMVTSVTIKSIQDTTEGMIRFFIYDPSTTAYYALFREVGIPLLTRNNVFPAFVRTIYFNNLFLAPNVRLSVSTENSETFNITASALKIISYS